MELKGPKDVVGIQTFRGRLWIMLVGLFQLFSLLAAKEPSPELIASCEERYRQIYAEHGENIEITFPKHYPVSALVGCVDVVDVIPHELLSKVPIPHTVGYLTRLSLLGC